MLRQGREFLTVTPEVQASLAEPTPIIVTKANIKSRVHPAGVPRLYRPQALLAGRPASGETAHCCGLFTANAYDSPVAAVPFLRRKAEAVLSHAALDPSSYMGRALNNVLETYPRDELFQIDLDTLKAFASDILTLSERPRIRALARLRDRFDRFDFDLGVHPKRTAMILGSHQQVGMFLAQTYAGTPRRPHIRPIPTAPSHVRILSLAGASMARTPDVPRSALESGIAAIVHNWADELRAAGASSDHPGVTVGTIPRRLPDRAIARPMAPRPLADIAVLEGLEVEGGRAVRVAPHKGSVNLASLKLYTRNAPLALLSPRGCRSSELRLRSR